MPHVNIKLYSPLSSEQKSGLALAITKAIIDNIKCEEGAVSIALETIDKELWHNKVYIPEIINRKEFLCKSPTY